MKVKDSTQWKGNAIHTATLVPHMNPFRVISFARRSRVCFMYITFGSAHFVTFCARKPIAIFHFQPYFCRCPIGIWNIFIKILIFLVFFRCWMRLDFNVSLQINAELSLMLAIANDLASHHNVPLNIFIFIWIASKLSRINSQIIDTFSTVWASTMNFFFRNSVLFYFIFIWLLCVCLCAEADVYCVTITWGRLFVI